MTGERYPALDGVRGIAILLVMQLHFWGMPFRFEGEPVVHRFDRWAAEIVDVGWTGVELFFVLSGFLITRILLQAKGSNGYARNFYLRRTLRIFPAYYGFLLVSIFVLPRLGFLASSEAAGTLTSEQLWLWTYTLNIGFTFQETTPDISIWFVHLWSLSLEEQFYIVWPFVVLAVGRRNLAMFCVAVVVGSLGLRFALGLDAFSDVFTAAAPRQLMPAHADGLALGGLLALAAVRGTLPSFQAPIRIGGTIGALALVAIFIAKDGLPLQDRVVQTWGFAALGFLFFWLVYVGITAREATKTFSVLNVSLLRAFGRYSYVMYLVHILVGLELANLLAKAGVPFTIAGLQAPFNVLFVALASMVTLGIGWLSWTFYETRFLDLRPKFGEDKVSSFAEVTPQS